MPNKDTTPLSLYGNDREYLREQEKTNELLADIAGEEYESPGDIPNGKYVIQKRLLDAAQKRNELLDAIAEGSVGSGAAKAIGIDYATDIISLKNKDGDVISSSGATLPAYGVSFDPTTGGLTLTKNGTAVQGQTVTIPNYGSPVGVTDSADMVDEGTIYLYEGETGGGFTNGHFYYYDGTAWADGGEYAAATVQTDKTLLVEDRAADAKATGEAVGELKTQISTTDNLNYSVLDGVTISSNKVSTNSKCASVYIRCEPNREYTVSKNAGGRFAVGDTSSYPANGVDCNDVERDNTASTITYKTSNSAVYLIALVYFSDTDGDTAQAKETMLGSVRIQTLSANDVSARDDISKINAETAGYVANKRLLEDPIKGKLIDCLRNVAFINQSGGSVLRSFVNSVGVDSWIDIKGSYTVRTDIDGDIHSTTDERAISRFIDVTGFDSITSEFKDGISPTVQYAVYCYDADKEYLDPGDPSGAKQGTTLRQFVSGTKYIRLMFLSANSEAPISEIADKYTGRLLYITFGGSNPSEQICCLTKTEDLSDVL